MMDEVELPPPPPDVQVFTSSGEWTKPVAPPGFRPYETTQVVIVGASAGTADRPGADGFAVVVSR